MIKNNKIINIFDFHQYQCFWKKTLQKKIDNFPIPLTKSIFELFSLAQYKTRDFAALFCVLELVLHLFIGLTNTLVFKFCLGLDYLTQDGFS